jgi:hypothetical protein
MPPAHGAPPGPAGGARWIGRLVLLLGLAAFVLPALSPGPDADVWWHLRAGNDFLAGRPGTFVESWSFTAAGTPWVNHEWLAEVFFALAARAGDGGVVALAALLMLGTGLLVARAAAREKLPLPVIAVALALAPLVMGDRVVPRPQLFSYVLLALTLERFGAARRGEASWWWLPAIQLLWTNLHGPVIGLATMTLLLVGGGAAWRRRLPVLGAVAVASIAHPAGIRALTDYLAHLGADGLYKTMVQEWQPLLHATQDRLAGRWPTIALAAVTLLGTVIAQFRDRRPGRWGIALLLAGLCAAPFAAARHRDLLAVAALPAFALLTGPWPSPAPRTRLVLRIGGAIVTLLLLAVPLAGPFGLPATWPPRPRLDRSAAPAEATAFLAAHAPASGGRIFGTYDFGGWLVHALPPAWRVFVDGRYFVYGEPLVREYLETRDGAPGARERLAARGADWLVVRYPAADGYGALAAEASRWPEWALVHWDDRSLVYARRDVVPAAFLERHAYRTIDPTLTVMPDDPAWWQAHLADIVREGWRATRAAPGSAKPRLLLALAFERAGRDGDAAWWYQDVLRLYPAHRVAVAGVVRIGGRHGRSLPPATDAERLRKEFGLEP